MRGTPSDADSDATFSRPRPRAARSSRGTLILHTLLYLPAQIVGPIGQFVAILVFTHWMAPEPYGVFTYVLASQDFVFFLCVAWWSQYTVRYFSDHADRADNSYLDSEVPILAGTLIVQVAASLFALSLLSKQQTPVLVLAAVLSTITRCLTLHLGERARAQSCILDYTIAVTAGPLAGFVVAFIAVVLIAPTPEVALFGYAAVQGTAMVSLLLRQGIAIRLRPPDQALLRQALSFGFPLIVAGVAAWAGLNAIRVVIDREMGSATMGLVAVGWGLGHRVTAAVAMLVTVAAFPLAVEQLRGGSRDRAFDEIARNGVLMLGIVLPAAVGLYAVQEPLIALTVAEPFRAMTAAILPAALVAGAARNLRNHIADQIFFLVEQTAMVCLMSVIEGVLVVLGCIVGLFFGGAVGAAIGCAGGYVVAMVVGFVIARIKLGLRIPAGEVVSIVTATTLMALAVETIGRSPLASKGAIESLVAEIASGVMVYGLTIVLLFPSIPQWLWRHWRRSQPSRSWKKS